MLDLSSDESFSGTPPELTNIANKTTNNLLPSKSKDVYMQNYQQFMDWRIVKNANSFSENVILAYFTELSNKMKPSTLWKLYSMLRTTINIKHNVDLSLYPRLRAFLKRRSDGYHAKKSKTLSAEEVNKFIVEAPDKIYLATKVALIVGIMGACRKNELYQMKIQDVQDLGTAVLISVPDTKTKISRKFTITDNFYEIFKRYIALRPANAGSDKLFLNYQNGRCTKQVIGINKLGYLPKQVAIFLNLSEPELYTGHCFRRTSATMLVDAGANITTLKRHGGWKSSEVAEGYIDNSLNNRLKVANQIMTQFPEQQPRPSPRPDQATVTSQSLTTSENIVNTPMNNLKFENCQNVTINIITRKEE